MIRAEQRRRAAVFVFGFYAGVVFVGTHWPKLVLPIPIHRPDLLVHMTLFGGWTVMCIAAAPFGRSLSVRNILACHLVSLIYSGIDEGLQAIPFIKRTAALDDFGANTCGVIAATLAALLVGWVRRRGTGKGA